MQDNYTETLSKREALALELTDALIGDPDALTAERRAALLEEFSDREIAELALGVGLFYGVSKVLIAVGVEPEPETMATTVLPAPGSMPR